MNEPTYRYTRHQVARGTRPDAEDAKAYYLFKSVRVLEVTYQVRLLSYHAWKNRKKLVIEVPPGCSRGQSLVRFMKEHPGLLQFETVS